MSTFALIVPTYNEGKTLNALLDMLVRVPRVSEIVVVNDGSGDETGSVLRRRLETGDGRVRVVTHEVNRGKGAAIQSGINAATTDFAVIQDADTEYDPNDLQAIFDLLEKGQPVVFGSRFLSSNPNRYFTNLAGNKVLTTFANVLGGGHLTDSYTCYKAMSLTRWRQLGLESNGFEIEAEIAMKCLTAKWPIVEVPVHYKPRTFAEGKKIRSTDAVKGILTFLKYFIFRRRIDSR